MTIALVLITVFILMAISYLIARRQPASVIAEGVSVAAGAKPVRAGAFAVPENYSFHPGHTWVAVEPRQHARIGIDRFAANLFGAVERIDVVGLNRWVRQGQKLCTVTRGEMSVDVLSPMEGVIVEVNADTMRDPGVVVADPYGKGWLCAVKAPDLENGLRNLIRGSFVVPWMQATLRQLTQMAAPNPALAQDGGVPVPGLLTQLTPELQRKIVREFFLT
jgi:glycine cleavage system H lipoate-binding protein